MKRISPEALAQTDELLAKMRGVASVPSDHLEAWWSTKPRVRRVELFRLLNDLADDGRVAKLPGRRWGLPANVVPVEPVTVTPPMPVQPKVSVTLKVDGRPEDAVTITGQVKERVEAVVRAYQRDTARGTTARPSAPQPKADTRHKPAPGTIAHKILASLKRGPKRADVMASLLDLNPNTLRGRLSELAAGGWLAKGDDGRWEVIS